MRFSTLHTSLFLPLLGVLFFTSISLEAQNEIVQNPEAVLLRRVWMMRGGVVGGDRVGALAGALTDVNHDSLQDFIWGLGSTGVWHLQYGGSPISDTPAQSFFHSTTLSYPVVGNFWGGSQEYVVFADFYTTKPAGRTQYHPLVKAYAIDNDTIDLRGVGTFDPSRGIWPGLESTITDMFAVDLNQDGDDELIVIVPGIQFDQEVDKRAEVWIFEGGPEFQLDTPTVVLKDTEENLTDVYAAVGDLDGDSLPDLMIGANYVGTGPGNRPIRYKFWWGKNRLSDLSIIPDHSVTLDKASVNIDAKFTLLDCDGDGVKDILRLLYTTPLGVYLYRSAAGKNIRDRQLTIDDADGYFPGYSIFGSGGYLGDSLQRFESIIMLGARVMFFQGGKNGPNYSYDAYYSAADGGLTPGNVFGQGGPVGDVSGNGWEDYLTANPGWFNLEQGIVILLEGGPYIPTDDTTSGVEVVATVEHGSALHIWPNPVTDELHVAWRGDLKASPSLLRVYDMSGRLVVDGSVEGWRGEAVWKCGSVAVGSYLLVVYDRNERMLAQTNIIKEE
ncbi:MAG: FG-GAP-like repeat-containing protein [Candidatus Kapaibacterium sp.]